jgi:hypothetical protein
MKPNEAASPVEALDGLFQAIRTEAETNPEFAHRIARALKMNIMFRGDEALLLVDPVLVADQGQLEFRKTFTSFSVQDLKKIATEHNLATSSDLRRFRSDNAKPKLIDLMWNGAVSKLRDVRHA